ncbi:MAG: SelB C-terminal domain-containing protein [Treponemataceae bacterium]
MIVLGLAGHVDHGKTALVRALTGTDTDRLPEEKARGMTTDLGFASVSLSYGENGETVALGVVDVPGHERYIRNMAAGAWGVDIALLVVAADDGWMAQTETHSRVLAAFGPPRVIPVITKIDMVEPARVCVVASDVFRRSRAVLGEEAVVPSEIDAVLRVSALRGDGMEELRRVVAAEAASLERFFRPAESSKSVSSVPYLFVDRIFSKRGAGLVICGTLRGGSVRVGDELVSPSSGEIARVRGVETLGASASLAEARSRAAFNVAGLKKESVRGDLLVAASSASPSAKSALDVYSHEDFLVGEEFLVRLEAVSFSDDRITSPFRSERETETELVVGSAVRFARCYLVGKGPFARLLCRGTLAIPLDAKAALVRHGGSDLRCALRFLRTGATDREQRRSVSAAVADLESVPLQVARFVLETRLRSWREADETAPEARVLAPFNLVRTGDFFLTIAMRDATHAAIARLSALPGGLHRAALASSLALPRALIDALISAMTSSSSKSKAAGNPGVVGEKPTALPAALLEVAERLKTAGSEGFDSSPPAPGVRRKGPVFSRSDIEALCKVQLAVPIDRTLFLHRDVYRELVEKVLRGRAIGDRFLIAEVKNATGYSRKYALPFLNRLERDGYVKRDGDDRIVTSLSFGT